MSKGTKLIHNSTAEFLIFNGQADELAREAALRKFRTVQTEGSPCTSLAPFSTKPLPKG